jgi:hypothetical protein
MIVTIAPFVTAHSTQQNNPAILHPHRKTHGGQIDFEEVYPAVMPIDFPTTSTATRATPVAETTTVIV